MPSTRRARTSRRPLRLLAGTIAATLVTGGAVLLAPHAAIAAPAFDASAIYATQSGSSNIVSIDRTTGTATTVLTAPTAPANNGNFNQLGISADGDKLYMTDSSTVREYTASTNGWESTQRSAGPTVSTTMGGVDPKSQKYFFGGQQNGATFTFTSYDPATNTIATPAITVSAPNPPGGNGDLAFDRQGNMYFVSSSNNAGNTNTAQLYRVDATDLGGGSTTATAVGPLIQNTPALNSLAFSNDGYLYIAGNGTNAFLKVNPVNGKTVAANTVSVSITDMASNAVPSTGQTQGGFTDGRAKPTDEVTTTISGGDIPTPVSGTTTPGNDTVSVGPIILLPGQTYTVDQTPGNSTTNPADYDTSYKCVNLVDGSTVAQGKGTSAPFTAPAAGGDVQCAFSNPLKPTVTNTSSTGNTPDQPVTVSPLAHSQGTIDPTTVTLTPNTPTSTVSSSGKQLTVPGEGVWTIDPTTGTVTFTPETGSAGNPTPVTYTVDDTRGNQTSGQIAVTYKGTAQPDIATTTQGTAVMVDVLRNDQGGTVPSSVVFSTSGEPTGAQASADGKQMTVPGEGTYTIDPSTGALTFTPVPSFRGTTSPVSYRVTDADGSTSAAAVTVQVDAVAPRVGNTTAATQQNTPTTVDVVADATPGVQGGTPIDPTSVVFTTTGQPNGAQVSADGKQLTVPGQGSYVIDPTTGKVAFTPAQGFTGTATAVSYQISDTGGATGTATLTVTTTPVFPTANADTTTLTQGGTRTIDVLGNDVPGNTATPLEPTSIVFPTAGQPNGAQVSVDGKQLTFPDQGRYVIDPAAGTVTFASDPTFRGTTTPVSYRVADTDGTMTTAPITTTVTPVGPAVKNDSATTEQNTPVTVDALDNDGPGVSNGTPLDPTSVVFPTTGQPTGATVSPDGKQLSVPGAGSYVIDPTSGEITFTPASGFSGTTTPVTYQVADTGMATATATITVTVTPVTPTAKDDEASTPVGTSVTVPVLGNDVAGNAATSIDPTKVELLTATGTPVRQLTVVGKGAFTVDPASGTITFTPVTGFSGPVAVPYRITDTDGHTSDAVLTVVVGTPPTATGDSVTGKPGTATVVDVLGNDGPGTSPIDPATVRIVDPRTGKLVDTVTIADEGTFAVQPSGTVTFTPVAGYAGTATASYSVAGDDGSRATATVSVTYPAVPGIAPNPAQSGGVVVTMPSGTRLAFTGSEVLWPGLGASFVLLIIGFGMTLLRRRRTALER